MKSFFKILLVCLSLDIHAYYIQLSYKEKDHDFAEKLHSILRDQFQIPSSMINFEQISDQCNASSKVKAIHLCIEKENINVIFRNQRVIDETLGVFWK